MTFIIYSTQERNNITKIFQKHNIIVKLWNKKNNNNGNNVNENNIYKWIESWLHENNKKSK